MKIAGRVALTVILALGLGAAGIVGLAAGLLLDDFEALESREAERDAERLQELVANDLVALEFAALQFAEIAPLLVGSGDENSTLLLLSLLQSDSVDVIVLEGEQNGTSFGLAFQLLSTPPFFQELDRTSNDTLLKSTIFDQSTALTPASGIITANGTTYLVAALPIQFGTSTFAFAVASTMDDEYMRNLESLSGHELRIEPGSGSPRGLEISRPSSKQLETRVSFAGVEGEEAAAVIIHDDRDVYQGGLRSILAFVAATALILAAATGLILWMIRATVTARLRRLSAAMERLRVSGRLQDRLDEPGSDELADMAHAFDALVADLEQATVQLRVRNKDLERFASTVSHDLKSPLSTVFLNVNLMRRLDVDAKHLDRIERSATTIKDTIEKLLEDARGQAKIRAYSLENMVDRVVSELEQTYPDAKIVRGDLPLVMGTEARLRTIIQNLLTNAVKYRHPDRHPVVDVRARAVQGGIILSVRDNGVGFTADEANQLTKQFSRLDQTADREGHGLGLAAVREAARKLGGSMRISGKPGEGALFEVLLRPAE